MPQFRTKTMWMFPKTVDPHNTHVVCQGGNQCFRAPKDRATMGTGGWTVEPSQFSKDWNLTWKSLKHPEQHQKHPQISSIHSCNAQKAKGQLRKSRYLGSRKLGFAYFLKVKHWGFLVQQHRNGVFFVVIYNNKPPIREWFIPPIKMVIWGMVCYCFTITLDQIRWLVSFIFRSGELGNETPRSSQHWRSKWPGWHIYIHYMILIWYNYHISIKHVYGCLWIYDINRWTYISTYIYEYLNVEMHVNIYIYICMVPCPVFPPQGWGGMS